MGQRHSASGGTRRRALSLPCRVPDPLCLNPPRDNRSKRVTYLVLSYTVWLGCDAPVPLSSVKDRLRRRARSASDPHRVCPEHVDHVPRGSGRDASLRGIHQGLAARPIGTGGADRGLPQPPAEDAVRALGPIARFVYLRSASQQHSWLTSRGSTEPAQHPQPPQHGPQQQQLAALEVLGSSFMLSTSLE